MYSDFEQNIYILFYFTRERLLTFVRKIFISSIVLFIYFFGISVLAFSTPTPYYRC